jgi:multicomponent Na+:H+ antiporter subunit D
VIAFETFYAAPELLAKHAPILLAAGPLIGAAAAAMAPNSRWAWMISVGGAIFAGWMALAVAGEVARRGVVDYAIGGFLPPLGIAFRIDALGASMALLISFIGIMAALYSGHALYAEVREEKHPLVQAGFLLCVGGMLGIVVTGDAFNAFVFLEIASLAAYALVAVGERGDRRALPAAFNYLVFGSIGAAFFVIGVGFLYAATGTLNMADIAGRVATLTESRAVQAGFAFIVVGLGLKAAMFPLHAWLPGAYAYAPSLAAVFIAGVATKTSMYLLARFVFGIFDPAMGFVSLFMAWILAPLAAAAAIVCSIQAVFETDLRRMLAFSSVAQAGLILLAFAAGSHAGVAAGMMMMIAHAPLVAAFFTALGGAFSGARARSLTDFAGAGRDAPWTMAAFAISAASLIGVPFTAGFLAKWRLVEAMLQGGAIWAVAVIAASSVLTLIYGARMLEALFLRSAPAAGERAKEAPAGVLVPLWILALASLWFGIDGAFPENLADASAAVLTGGRP